MRPLLIGAATALALTACADGAPRDLGVQSPMGQSEFHRSMRENERAGGRSSRPYSVPPESSGAPLAAPMAQSAEAGSSQRPAQGAETTATTARVPAQPTPRDRAEADTPGDAPREGTAGTGETVPLVRVDDDGAGDGPNVIAYALSTTHAVGTERYPRRNPLRWQRWERNCLQFSDQNSAQEAFLAAGGPERDRHNLDPVGDGFACWWDPEPIRRAARAGN